MVTMAASHVETSQSVIHVCFTYMYVCVCVFECMFRKPCNKVIKNESHWHRLVSLADCIRFLPIHKRLRKCNQRLLIKSRHYNF